MQRARDRAICFVIGPIGDIGSDTRHRSDAVLKYLIVPVVTRYGYRAVRADQIGEPGLITMQIVRWLLHKPLVIADLTGQEANVFYELCLRHAIRKPMIQLAEEGEKLPFNVQDSRTIFFNHRDLESVASAKKELGKQIRALANSSNGFDTPISFAFDDLLAEMKTGSPRIPKVSGASAEFRRPSAEVDSLPSLARRRFNRAMGTARGRGSENAV